jgi:hypothetical protein
MTLLLVPTFYRLKIWAKLEDLKEEMERGKYYRKGQPATAAEYTRIVLTVAYAVSNPRNSFLFHAFQN